MNQHSARAHPMNFGFLSAQRFSDFDFNLLRVQMDLTFSLQALSAMLVDVNVHSIKRKQWMEIFVCATWNQHIT
jgi:hypothetical protein